MACRLPVGQTFLQIQYSMSAMSKLSGWVATRWVTLSESSAVISIVMPRSSNALSAISLKAETPVPAWRRTMLDCAQTIGAASVPAAVATPLFNRVRRLSPLRFVYRVMCLSLSE